VSLFDLDDLFFELFLHVAGVGAGTSLDELRDRRQVLGNAAIVAGLEHLALPL
jgi:hypothetical protein